MNEDDLRDILAMQALNGMISAKDWFSNLGRWQDIPMMTKTYAEEAYMFADAMLVARKKRYWVEPDEPESGIAAVKPRTRRKV